MTMFENEDVKNSRRMPPLVWAIIAGLVVMGITSLASDGPWTPIIFGLIAGILAHAFTNR